MKPENCRDEKWNEFVEWCKENNDINPNEHDELFWYSYWTCWDKAWEKGYKVGVEDTIQ